MRLVFLWLLLFSTLIICGCSSGSDSDGGTTGGAGEIQQTGGTVNETLSDTNSTAPIRSTNPTSGTTTTTSSTTDGTTTTSSSSSGGCAAKQGACSHHGVVNCSAGPDRDGSVICNDGWRGSSVDYVAG